MHGKATCLACGHKWVGVAPVGTDSPLQCSACGAEKGVFDHFVKYDAPAWHCESCNGYLFTLMLAQDVPCVACATCGNMRNAIDLWNK